MWSHNLFDKYHVCIKKFLRTYSKFRHFPLPLLQKYEFDLKTKTLLMFKHLTLMTTNAKEQIHRQDLPIESSTRNPKKFHLRWWRQLWSSSERKTTQALLTNLWRARVLILPWARSPHQVPETSNLLSNCSRKGSEARGQHCGKPAPEKSGLGRQSDELGAERRRECDGWLPFSKVFDIGNFPSTISSTSCHSPNISAQAYERQATRGGEGDLQEEEDDRARHGLLFCCRRGCRCWESIRSWEMDIMSNNFRCNAQWRL